MPNPNKIVEKLHVACSSVYVLLFELRFCAILAAQVMHLRSSLQVAALRSNNSDTPPGELEPALAREQEYREWLRYMSPLAPQAGHFNCMILAVYLVGPLYLQSASISNDKVHEYSLERYLRDPEAATREIERKLDGIIVDMQMSNVHHSSFLIQHMISGELSPNCAKSLIGKPDPRLLSHLMGVLAREYNYLYELRHDKRGLVWPCNRNADWAKLLRQLFVWISCVVTFTFIIYLQSIILVIMKRAHELEPVGLAERSRLRAWNHLDLHLLINYMASHAVMTFDEVVVSGVDISRLMASFRSLADRVQAKAAKLRDLTIELERGQQTSLSLQEYRLARDRIRFSSNKDAVRAYIALRYFIDELEPLHELMRRRLHHLVPPMFLGAFVTLLYYVEADPADTTVLLFVAVTLLIGANLALVLTAAFRAYCVRAINLVWSMIHCALELPVAAFAHQFDPSQEGSFKTRDVHAYGSPSHRHADDHDLSGRHATLEKHDDSTHEVRLMLRACNVSPHVYRLWQRMVSDNFELSSRFTCKVLGFLNLDYGGVLKINFYLMSIVMVYFTYR